MTRRSPTGMALPELMVALAVGAMLVLAASALVMQARNSYLLTGDLARIEENGRFAVAILGQAVRQAGYRDWGAAGAVEADWPAVSGLDARSLRDGSDGIGGPYGAAVNGSDVLALRFDGNRAGSGDTAMRNCAGASVAADAPGAGWSIFYIANDSLGEPELRCKYRTASGWNSDALVRGVDGFQVLYGLADAADGAAPLRYASASVVAQEATGWQRVVSLKVALLLRGNQPGPARSRRYDLFGADYADYAGYADRFDPADSGVRVEEARLPPASRGLQRRIHAATIFLRNRGGAGA